MDKVRAALDNVVAECEKALQDKNIRPDAYHELVMMMKSVRRLRLRV